MCIILENVSKVAHCFFLQMEANSCGNVNRNIITFTLLIMVTLIDRNEILRDKKKY